MVPPWMPIGVAALVLVILQACIGTGGLDSATPKCRHRRGRAGALRFARDALRLRGAGVAGIESSEDDLQLFLAHRRSVTRTHNLGSTAHARRRMARDAHECMHDLLAEQRRAAGRKGTQR